MSNHYAAVPKVTIPRGNASSYRSSYRRQAAAILLSTAFGLACLTGTEPDCAADSNSTTTPPGPVTADDEIIADLNFDAPGLEKVKTAIQANGLTAAKEAYLDYRRTAMRQR